MQRIASATSFADFGAGRHPGWVWPPNQAGNYFSRFTHLKTFEQLKTHLP